MKLRKFTGANTREVLRTIRDELGGDAMIVSSRQTSTGVEMIAMSSEDAQSVIDHGAAKAPDTAGRRAPVPPVLEATDPSALSAESRGAGRQVPQALDLLRRTSNGEGGPNPAGQTSARRAQGQPQAPAMTTPPQGRSQNSRLTPDAPAKPDKPRAQGAVAAATAGLQKWLLDRAAQASAALADDTVPVLDLNDRLDQTVRARDLKAGPPASAPRAQPLESGAAADRTFLDYALSISPAAKELQRRQEPRVFAPLAPSQPEPAGIATAPEYHGRGQRQEPVLPRETAPSRHASATPSSLPNLQASLSRNEPPLMFPREAQTLAPPWQPELQPAFQPEIQRAPRVAESARATAPPQQPATKAQPESDAYTESEAFATGAMTAFSPVRRLQPAGTPVAAAASPTSAAIPTLAASLSPFGNLPLQQFSREVSGVIAAEPRVEAPAASEPGLADAFRSLREFITQQWAGFAWRDATLRHPEKAMIWRGLTDAGFTPAFARALADKLPLGMAPAEVPAWLHEVVALNLRCCDRPRELIERGGRFALVGPAGVGKTTTTAKIAARCVARYGADSLGLIATDTQRIGGQDQLRSFGNILGVPVHTAQTAQDLASVIQVLGRKRLILVDSMGLGHRDPRLPEQCQMLASVGLKRLLVVAASSQAEVLEESLRAYLGLNAEADPARAAFPLAGCVVSKLDESVKLGTVLDALIRYKLELQYVATGHRIPDDLRVANAKALVHKALHHRAAPAFRMTEAEYDLIFMPSPLDAAQVGDRAGY